MVEAGRLHADWWMEWVHTRAGPLIGCSFRGGGAFAAAATGRSAPPGGVDVGDGPWPSAPPSRQSLPPLGSSGGGGSSPLLDLPGGGDDVRVAMDFNVKKLAADAGTFLSRAVQVAAGRGRKGVPGRAWPGRGGEAVAGVVGGRARPEAACELSVSGPRAGRRPGPGGHKVHR